MYWRSVIEIIQEARAYYAFLFHFLLTGITEAAFTLFSLLSGSLVLEVLLIGVHCKKHYVNVLGLLTINLILIINFSKIND